MQEFSGYEYLCIDIANNYNLKLDKEVFENRIAWTQSHNDDLELIGASHEWKEKPLYLKAVQALRKVQRGDSTGHLVGFDAVCSGLQLMSVLTGCVSGAEATGLINPDKRADAYKSCLEIMQAKIPTLNIDDLKRVKQALMTSFYGSKAEPEKLFGEGTLELQAFKESMYELSPGACELLKDLADSWQPMAEKHSWTLPDNHHVHVRVTDSVDIDVEVDELDHHTFAYRYTDLVPKEKGISNIANVIHSIDAYALRSLVRRCSYDNHTVMNIHGAIQYALKHPNDTEVDQGDLAQKPEFIALIKQYHLTGIADISIIDYITWSNVVLLSTDHLVRLDKTLEQMRKHPSFPIVTIHDDFKCRANNMNSLRRHYLEILKELADSTILDSIFQSLYNDDTIKYLKQSENLSSKMHNANYFLS